MVPPGPRTQIWYYFAQRHYYNRPQLRTRPPNHFTTGLGVAKLPSTRLLVSENVAILIGSTGATAAAPPTAWADGAAVEVVRVSCNAEACWVWATAAAGEVVLEVASEDTLDLFSLDAWEVVVLEETATLWARAIDVEDTFCIVVAVDWADATPSDWPEEPMAPNSNEPVPQRH